MSYLDFKNEWLGRHVDYDHVYGYQCVDLILEYIKEGFGLASGVSGNAIDYWYRPSAPLISKFDHLQTSDCSQGDMVVLGSGVGNPYGHVGICDSSTATTVVLLQQNGTGHQDPINLGTWGKNLVLGVLRPKSAPAPSPGNGTAEAIRPAYVRVAPSTSAALGGSRLLNPGDTFKYTAKVVGQDVNQNGVHTSLWYRSVFGNYVWTGNCKDI